MLALKKQSGILILALMLCALSSFNSHTTTESVRQALINLGDSNKAVREQAYEALRKEGDAGIVPILEAFQSGLLENREGHLVIYAPRVQTSKQKREYPLLDALTGKPLLDAKRQPLYAEEFSSSMMKANRTERKAITALIKTLSLQHADPEKRIAAIMAAGDKADVSLLPDLQKQLQANHEKDIAEALAESIVCIQIVHGTDAEKLKAVQLLGENRYLPRGLSPP